MLFIKSKWIRLCIKVLRLMNESRKVGAEERGGKVEAGVRSAGFKVRECMCRVALAGP